MVPDRGGQSASVRHGHHRGTRDYQTRSAQTSLNLQNPIVNGFGVADINPIITAAAPNPLDLLEQFGRKAGFVNITQSHVCSMPCEFENDGAADVAKPSADSCYLSLEFCHSKPSRPTANGWPALLVTTRQFVQQPQPLRNHNCGRFRS